MEEGLVGAVLQREVEIEPNNVKLSSAIWVTHLVREEVWTKQIELGCDVPGLAIKYSSIQGAISPILTARGASWVGNFQAVSRKVSRNLDCFHSKVSGKFPEKFGKFRKKVERNKEPHMQATLNFIAVNVCYSKLRKLTTKLGNISNIFSSKLPLQSIASFQVGTEIFEIMTNLIV